MFADIDFFCRKTILLDKVSLFLIVTKAFIFKAIPIISHQKIKMLE